MKGRKGSRGFSFAEMMGAAAIMVTLGTTLAATSLSLVNYNKGQSTKQELKDLKTGTERFYSDNRVLPPTLAALYIKPTGATSQWANWNGPYLSKSKFDADRDSWNRIYGFFKATTAQNVPAVLFVSPGKNGRFDADYSIIGWSTAIWNPAGDDIALEFPLRLNAQDMEDTTRNTLDLARGRILNDNPNNPPNNWGVSSYVDAWGNRVQFVRCSIYLSYVYSYGKNQVDNSNGGNALCTDPRAMGDDIVDSIVWEVRRTPATPTWEGGFDVQPTHCAIYTLTVINSYTAGTTVTVKHSSSSTSTVAGASTGTITAGPQSVFIWNGTLLLDEFKPASADLDSDCRVTKRVGILPPP